MIGTDLCQSMELTLMHADSQEPLKKPGGGVLLSRATTVDQFVNFENQIALALGC